MAGHDIAPPHPSLDLPPSALDSLDLPSSALDSQELPPTTIDDLVETSVDRRRFLRGSALAGASVLASSVLPAESALAVTPRVRFGAAAEPRGGESNQREAVLALERKLGRRLRIMRRYSFWEDGGADRTHRWASDGGRIPYMSWHAYTRGGRTIPWRSIARGDHDAYLRRTAQNLRAFRDPIFFNFHHEPENDPRNGSPADFRAAFGHVKHVFDNEGASNLHWMVTLMASTYAGGHGGAGVWLPPSYGMLGVDGYNRWPVERMFPWRSFGQIFAPARNWARARRTGLFIGEYGCVENRPGDKATWFYNAGKAVRSWPEVKAIVYSHRRASPKIAYWADSSRASFRSFRRMGASTYFRA
jgi:hypothetical protein